MTIDTAASKTSGFAYGLVSHLPNPLQATLEILKAALEQEAAQQGVSVSVVLEVK